MIFMAQQTTSASNNPVRVYVGSSLLFSWMVVSTLIMAPVIIACKLLPFPLRYKVARKWATGILKAAEICCGIRYEVHGLENIPANQSTIILSNHQSAWETIAFRCIFPRQTSLFKKSLLWIPFWGWAMATLKPIAIDRDSKQAALRKLITLGTQVLKDGLWVVVFPEGTRMPVGQMKAFSAGGALLAQKSGYPVLPVAHDAGKCWPRYSFLKYPGVIRVNVGPLIETKDRKAAEINQAAEQWVAQALNELGG